MKRFLCLLLCLLPLLSRAEAASYRGDGRYMLTATAEASLCTEPTGGEEITVVLPGARLIATDAEPIIGESGAWQEVYLPGYGYGYISSACVQPDEPLRIAYHPGFPVNAALFTVADAGQVYMGVTSLDNLEYPVITVQRLYAQPLEDGGAQMCAAFSTASDVCKTTSETLCATLFDLTGQPLEVRTLIFDAPLWR